MITQAVVSDHRLAYDAGRSYCIVYAGSSLVKAAFSRGLIPAAIVVVFGCHACLLRCHGFMEHPWCHDKM